MSDKPGMVSSMFPEIVGTFVCSCELDKRSAFDVQYYIYPDPVDGSALSSPECLRLNVLQSVCRVLSESGIFQCRSVSTRIITGASSRAIVNTGVIQSIVSKMSFEGMPACAESLIFRVEEDSVVIVAR